MKSETIPTLTLTLSRPTGEGTADCVLGADAPSPIGWERVGVRASVPQNSKLNESFAALLKRPCWFLLMALAASFSARADMTNTASASVNQPIPDNNINGVSSTIALSSTIDQITDVNITLNISGNFNGDLYAYVTHNSATAILLNRPGRTAMNTFGYPDGGFNVGFDDAAPNGDIHVYRMTVNPNGGVLTGTWAPDARNTDPALTLDTDARTRFLDQFNGQNANGTWTLFVSDLSPAGTSTFQSWSLEVIGVPEPGAWVLMSLGGLGLFLAVRRTPRG